MLGSALGLLVAIVVSVAAVSVLASGQRHAWFFIGAGAATLCGVTLNAFRNFGWAPDVAITAHGNQVGSLVAVLLLAFALGARFVAMQREREQARSTAEEMERAAAAGQRLVLEARLQSLQAKINPHFLFNTLNTISGLIIEDPARAETLVVRLSALFRHALKASECEKIPLTQEIEMLRQYLEIECARFAPRLRYDIEVRGAIEGISIPGLTLQPLVENAIKHGLRPKRGPGHMSILAEVNAGRCRIVVRDDGVGLDPKRVASGHGLASVRERLRLAYGGAASMTVTNDEGVRVEMLLPTEAAPC
jgi:LytS/YehU family sensor histidine kinase